MASVHHTAILVSHGVFIPTVWPLRGGDGANKLWDDLPIIRFWGKTCHGVTRISVPCIPIITVVGWTIVIELPVSLLELWDKLFVMGPSVFLLGLWDDHLSQSHPCPYHSCGKDTMSLSQLWKEYLIAMVLSLSLLSCEVITCHGATSIPDTWILAGMWYVTQLLPMRCTFTLHAITLWKLK